MILFGSYDSTLAIIVFISLKKLTLFQSILKKISEILSDTKNLLMFFKLVQLKQNILYWHVDKPARPSPFLHHKSVIYYLDSFL